MAESLVGKLIKFNKLLNLKSAKVVGELGLGMIARKYALKARSNLLEEKSARIA